MSGSPSGGIVSPLVYHVSNKTTLRQVEGASNISVDSYVGGMSANPSWTPLWRIFVLSLDGSVYSTYFDVVIRQQFYAKLFRPLHPTLA